VIFLNHLMKKPPFDPTEAYNIWIYDFIGQDSQGVAISRETHQIIVGQRSTKGYEKITVRPIDCLGKTMAHELGHALSLEHLISKPFHCGAPRNDDSRKNLMSGGSDKSGGGGEHLDDWQIVSARGEAVRTIRLWRRSKQRRDQRNHEHRGGDDGGQRNHEHRGGDDGGCIQCVPFLVYLLALFCEGRPRMTHMRHQW